MLGDRVGAVLAGYCGAALARCRKALRASLAAALSPREQPYRRRLREEATSGATTRSASARPAAPRSR